MINQNINFETEMGYLSEDLVNGGIEPMLVGQHWYTGEILIQSLI